jgi:ATP-dependent DNA helicase RecG
MKIALVTTKSKESDLSEFDFIIGTHALLFREIPKADLIMVDEQHRFGTNQRALIQKLTSKGKKAPHFIQFSATPIPRTLAMINSSLVNFSFIKELPYKKEIETRIIKKEHFKELLEHIEREILQNHQTIIVYPLVEESESIDYQSIEEAKSFWLERFERVYVTFGKDKEKEEILESFRDNGNILLTTTVVEVGISLPRLTTIVIVAPERLGFATLHQLRGRVSRNGLKGYCFLFTKLNESKRIEEFIKTTNGFDIAELDLKFRQSGDLLYGHIQSGRSFEWIDLSNDIDIIQEAKDDVEKLSLEH